MNIPPQVSRMKDQLEDLIPYRHDQEMVFVLVAPPPTYGRDRVADTLPRKRLEDDFT